MSEALNGTHGPTSQDKPTAQLVSVSPAMARDWLATRHANRPLSQQRVKRIAAAIKAGLWALNGQPLIVCEHNQLIDGQHRCAAIEQAGINVQTLVVFGVDVRTFPTVDQGKKRSGGDVLAIAGHAQAQTLASALRWCWRYEHQQMLSASIAMEDHELPAFLEQHRGIMSSLSWGLSIKTLLPPGAATMLHMKMHTHDPGLAKAVFMALASGLELTASDPVYLVRERYIAMGRALFHTAVVERAAALVRAWNARRGGRPLPQGKWAGTSAHFPTVE